MLLHKQSPVIICRSGLLQSGKRHGTLCSRQESRAIGPNFGWKNLKSEIEKKHLPQKNGSKL